MGTVYRATHLALDHVVALKVISGDLASDEAFRARFQSESRIAVSLRHPNVVPIHHAGEEDGLLFVTMDLIDGPDLRRLLLAGGPLKPERAAALISQVAAALDVAHANGLVHRDIKPGNVLVEQRAEGEHAYLTDFGLAKRFDQGSEAGGLTGTGAFVGTLDYVAPEQIRGDRVDARTDVYALGCVLYETMSGRSPFADREENVAKIYAHLQDEPPWLPGDIENELDEVISRAMAKEPGDRFPSAGDLARAADAAAAGSVSRVGERSVATGKAAPVTPVETLHPPAPTEESPPPPPPTEPAATEPLAEPPRRPASPGRDGPPKGLLIGGALAATVLVVVLLSSLGSGESPGGDVTETVDNSEPEAVAIPARFERPIRVPGFPVGLSIQNNEVTTADRNGRSVTAIDKKDRQVVRTTQLPGQAEDIEAIGNFAWVTMPKEDKVAKVPLEGGDVIQIVRVGDTPRGITAAGESLWVANEGSSEISRIDPASGDVTSIALTDAEPTDIAFDGTALWVTDRAGDSVIRREIDGDGEEEFPVGDNPKGVVIFENEVFVANTDSSDVTRLSLEGAVTGDPIEVGGTPRGIASGFEKVWVANGGESDEDGYVSAFDPDEDDVQKVKLGGSPEEIAEGPELMWVTTGSGNSLASIDPNPRDDEPSP